jgi:hypothetical protein
VTKNRRRIDLVRSPEFVADLTELDIDELRRRRRICDELDTELSYYRRLLHGRMDLLSFEMRRRSGEEERSLIEALPEILAGATPAAGPVASRRLEIEAPEFSGRGRRAIDRVLGDDFLVHLHELDDEDVERIQAMLTDAETEISQQRRAVFEAHDAVQHELTRRYREGLADPHELLQQD